MSARDPAAPLVTLLSDFGLLDGYAGAMKGAVLSVCPSARLVDLTHQVPPGDLGAASRLLAQAAPYFPEAAVHLAVVDPGVGTARRAIAACIDGRRYVAPDNGLLSGVLEGAEQVEVRELSRPGLWRSEVCPVFHGRDVFGPVAGHLAAGLTLADAGDPFEPGDLVRLPAPRPQVGGDTWRGEVVAVDGFGNLVTNLPAARGRLRGARVEVGGRSVPTGRTYADVPAGELLALIGSTGRIEIACHRGRAADRLGGGPGLAVVVRWPSGGPE